MKNLSEKRLHGILIESIRKVTLNERKGLKSPKLYDILKKHGGFGSPTERPHSRHYGNFSNLTDNDIIGVMTRQEVQQIQNSSPTIDHWRWAENFGLDNWAREQGFDNTNRDSVSTEELKDGNLLVYIERNANFDRFSSYEPKDGDFPSYYEKQNTRRKNRALDGKNEYVSMTPKGAAAREYRKNPYPWLAKQGKREGDGWNSESRRNAMNNIRKGKDAWGYDPKQVGNAYIV